MKWWKAVQAQWTIQMNVCCLTFPGTSGLVCLVLYMRVCDRLVPVGNFLSVCCVFFHSCLSLCTMCTYIAYSVCLYPQNSVFALAVQVMSSCWSIDVFVWYYFVILALIPIMWTPRHAYTLLYSAYLHWFLSNYLISNHLVYGEWCKAKCSSDPSFVLTFVGCCRSLWWLAGGNIAEPALICYVFQWHG